jgi:hypothetical protein
MKTSSVVFAILFNLLAMAASVNAQLQGDTESGLLALATLPLVWLLFLGFDLLERGGSVRAKPYNPIWIDDAPQRGSDIHAHLIAVDADSKRALHWPAPEAGWTSHDIELALSGMPASWLTKNLDAYIGAQWIGSTEC